MDLCLVQRFIPLYSGAFVEFGALKYVSLSLSYLPSERGKEGGREKNKFTLQKPNQSFFPPPSPPPPLPPPTPKKRQFEKEGPHNVIIGYHVERRGALL